MTDPSPNRLRKVLITGGAGFIGSNLAARLLQQPGTQVTIYDNLSRSGVEHNLYWLESSTAKGRLQFLRGDVRDFEKLTQAVRGVDEIYHLAAQVAVTTSVEDPRPDFEVNAEGTFNVLEAARHSGRRPLLLFTSTNKVYGHLATVAVHEHGQRYEADDRAFRGASEDAPLDFHSPYGCSKGAADQYVRDYARIYDLPTVVFRMSCIAGPRQFGNEDQGWVAHFLYSAVSGSPITVYGTGLQVRDVLHVEDLIDAMESVRENIETVKGKVYNVGGGLDRSCSILEMLEKIQQTTGCRCECEYGEVRPGDQPLYISDTLKLAKHTGWRPSRSLQTTLDDIFAFWKKHHSLIEAQRHPFAPATGMIAAEVA